MRVLVVEDEPRMAGLLRRGLSAEGWRVDVAADAPTARDAVIQTDYDVLVCDVMLPGATSGIDLCRSLRRIGIWMPILLLTARSAVADRVSGLDAGADDYLVKPFAFSELTARLRALGRRGEQNRPQLLEVGDVRLDPGAHEVWAAGSPVELTAREFALLEYLMRRSGQVVSRSDILDHVWDYAFDGVSNVVDVYIGYLRRKLAAAGVPDHITTVRGIGYRCGSARAVARRG